MFFPLFFCWHNRLGLWLYALISLMIIKWFSQFQPTTKIFYSIQKRRLSFIVTSAGTRNKSKPTTGLSPDAIGMNLCQKLPVEGPSCPISSNYFTNGCQQEQQHEQWYHHKQSNQSSFHFSRWVMKPASLEMYRDRWILE